MHLPARAAAAGGAGGGDEFSLFYIHFRSIHGMTVQHSWNTEAPLRGQGDRFAARGAASRAGAGTCRPLGRAGTCRTVAASVRHDRRPRASRMVMARSGANTPTSWTFSRLRPSTTNGRNASNPCPRCSNRHTVTRSQQS